MTETKEVSSAGWTEESAAMINEWNRLLSKLIVSPDRTRKIWDALQRGPNDESWIWDPRQSGKTSDLILVAIGAAWLFEADVLLLTHSKKSLKLLAEQVALYLSEMILRIPAERVRLCQFRITTKSGGTATIRLTNCPSAMKTLPQASVVFIDEPEFTTHHAIE